MSAPLRINPDVLPHPAKLGRDAASAWLDRVTAMLRVPASEREAIRAELNEHLRERIRDLMLAGASEQAATSQAISELGDAASLARRYQEAIEPSSRRSLMHVGIATAATAALVVSGAALFQSGSTPTPPPANSGNALAASAPAISPREDAMRAELNELRDALTRARITIAEQERIIARATGESESLQGRVKAAEDRAAEMQQESFIIQRQYRTAQEDLHTTQADLEAASRDRDAAMAELKELKAQAAAGPARTAAPATYAPQPNPAREILGTLNIDMGNASTLGAIMAQPTIRDAKVYLRNETLSAIKFEGGSEMSLPNRQISLGELLDLVNAMGTGLQGLSARTMPDGRIAIDLIETWDRADRTLVIYDLGDIAARDLAKLRRNGPIAMGPSSIEQLRMVITKTVTPDLWQDNGGDIGAISVLDSALVVTAPERSHHQIRWIIEQLRNASAHAEVPILSDVPIVGYPALNARGQGVASTRPRKHDNQPSTIEVKGQPTNAE